MSKRIVITGYYGYGNLGDDILMMITYRITNDLFPNHEIIVCSDSAESSYIPNLLQRPVQVLKSDASLHAEWIIHGGGGVFFDFNAGGVKFCLLNSGIKLIGYRRYKALYHRYRKFRGNAAISCNRRAGLGIGVGTYTASSRRLYADILILSDYDFLLVRDKQSVDHVRNFGLEYPLHYATDLAFLYHYWRPAMPPRTIGAVQRVGFILRDWPYDNSAYLKILNNVADMLQSRNYDLRFYSFDQYADEQYINTYSRASPLVIWKPAEGTLHDFLTDLSSCHCVVTSRAHGAIIAACLGIPSVILGIEPKLEVISMMLNHSSTIVRKPFVEQDIVNAVEQKLLQPVEIVEQDVLKNFNLMAEGVKLFREFIEVN